MDFFIKASYAAGELKDKAISNSPITVQAFFDDNRIVIMSLSLFLSVIVFGWQIYKHFQDKSDRKDDYALSIKEGYWHKSVVLPLFVDKFASSITEWIDAINNPDKSSVEKIRDDFKKTLRS
ncbi:MAG: hypothetical protein PHG00_10205 [Methylococcales bacterium]|nr:hypothetical protein [Methylococcales bacterium]